MKVLLAAQVVEFVRRLPPEPKQRMRRALRDLGRGRGDIKPLQSPLEGYCRLRVGGYRIVFAYGTRATIECVFAEQRSIVYALLLDRLRTRLRRGDE
jgi:mRNA-degrading endonuclease RelE of RelBE toxin-antitoxin system